MMSGEHLSQEVDGNRFKKERWKGVFGHTFDKKAPCIQDQINIEASMAYNEDKRIQDKHRRGGTSKDWIMNGIGDPDNPKEKKKKVIRYPEDGMSAQPKRQPRP
jgi:hypothetical protein